MAFTARIPVKFILHSGVKIKTYTEGYHDLKPIRATEHALDLLSRISQTLGGGPHPEEVTIDLPGCFILPSSIAAMEFGDSTVTGEAEATNRAYYIVWDLQKNDKGVSSQFCGFFGTQEEAREFWDNEASNRGYEPEGEISFVDLPFTYGHENIFYCLEVYDGIGVTIFKDYSDMKLAESIDKDAGRPVGEKIFFGGCYLKRGRYEGIAEHDFK